MIDDLVLENTFYYFRSLSPMLKIIFTGVFFEVYPFSNFATLFPSYMSKLERSNDALKMGHFR